MDFVPCIPMTLPLEQHAEAAERACDINPANRSALEGVAGLLDVEMPVEAGHLAVSRYWGQGGVKLTVAFLDSPPADLKARILLHMNSWGEFCNVRFMESNTDAQVRIARGQGGYWSYLGPDILSIPRGQPTMNLQGFTMNTPEGEFRRVVRHETGHTLGFPHEHMRREIVSRLDPQKTIQYFQMTQGWNAQQTRAQVLTPLDEQSIRGTPHADQDSIMAYQLPGAITIDGEPIRGGADIDPLDAEFAGKLYPLSVQPPPPKPPDGGGGVTLAAALAATEAAIEGVAEPLWYWPASYVRSVKDPVAAALRSLWK